LGSEQVDRDGIKNAALGRSDSGFGSSVGQKFSQYLQYFLVLDDDLHINRCPSLNPFKNAVKILSDLQIRRNL